MKTLYIFIFSYFLVTFSDAQVITTDPEFPVPGQSVTVYFDATQGNGALAGYSGDIYAHTGLITEFSSGPADWKYVKTNWNENTAETKLNKISDNYYSLDITPSVYDYYGAPTSEELLQLAFVFRNSDGTIVGRSQDGSDIFADLYSESNETISFTSPDTTHIYRPGNVNITAVALFANSMTLWVNDVEQTVVSGDNLSFDFNATSPGIHNVKVSATDGSVVIEEETYFYVTGNTVEEDLPSPGLKDGINYIDENTVTLVLFAPGKEFVYLRSSYNDWQLSTATQMKRTLDGERYWITLSGLQSGKEYIYQYNVDGNLIIADPYTEKILDPWNDQYINSSTYPDLIEYPEDKTDGIVSVFQTNQPDYNWEADSYVRPDKSNLIVYELLIRDFVADHNYQTLIDTFSYFKRLGINAIELLPVNEFEGNESWGYNPSFYFAPDKYYGTKNKLKEFIDLCHKNDIAVIIDMVLNHSFGQSPMVQLYFDPSAGLWGQPSPENPWFNEVETHPYNVGYDFNHESIYTKEFTKRVLEFWINEYKVDGFRFDLSKGFTQVNSLGDVGLWGQYDATRIAIWKEYYDYMMTLDPNLFVILEHFADNSEETELADYGMMIWGNMSWSFSQGAMGWPDGWDFSWASHQVRGWNEPNLVSYMESHDEERMMYKNLTYGNYLGDYDITEIKTALKRSELAAAFFFMIPGPKMIWQFGEIGYDKSINHCPDGSINEDCRTANKPILWDYFEDPYRSVLLEYYKIFIKLKTDYEALSTDDITLNLTGEIKEIILRHLTMDVVIVGNFGLETNTAAPDLTSSEKWYNYYNHEEYSQGHSFELSPGAYKILTSEKLEKPVLPKLPEYFKHADLFIYPNPVDDMLTVYWQDIYNKIEIVDISGNVLLEYVPLDRKPINLSSLRNGVYILKAVSDERTQTIKFIKL
jgi:glycosidase